MLRFQIDQPIVDTIVGDNFYPDDVKGVPRSIALSLLFLLVNEGGVEDNEWNLYLVEIKTVKRFTLATRLVALGDSFRCVAR